MCSDRQVQRGEMALLLCWHSFHSSNSQLNFSETVVCIAGAAVNLLIADGPQSR